MTQYIQLTARGGLILNQVAAGQIGSENSGGPTEERVHDSQVEGVGTSKGVKTGEQGRWNEGTKDAERGEVRARRPREC